MHGSTTPQWRHNGRDGVSNHRRLYCLLNLLFRRRSKKTSKLRVTGLCKDNPPMTGGSPHKGPLMRKMFPFDDVVMSPVYINKTFYHYFCADARWGCRCDPSTDVLCPDGNGGNSGDSYQVTWLLVFHGARLTFQRTTHPVKLCLEQDRDISGKQDLDIFGRQHHQGKSTLQAESLPATSFPTNVGDRSSADRAEIGPSYINVR